VTAHEAGAGRSAYGAPPPKHVTQCTTHGARRERRVIQWNVLKKHVILAAVDESENSRRAMDYLARWAACSEEARIVLVHVIKEPSEDVLPDEDERERYIGEKREAAEALLAKAKQGLESLGVPDVRIATKTLSCEPPTTIAEVLLEERGADAYDTMVLGRRGMSKKEEYIFGSVTASLIRDASDVSIWVVA
jgi:nucleotide-binding universal stress UspA family protein